MKCPITRARQVIDEEAFKYKIGDCLQEECAWWGKYLEADGKEIDCCSVPAIALALSDIMNRMPTEKQFRK